MNDESLEQIEQQFASMRPMASPAELRRAVLGDVHRELRAARRDRRFARAAAVLLMLGVGLNLANGLSSNELEQRQKLRVAEVRPSIVETAMVVAQASDVPTAQRIARQIAAMSGWELTENEEAAIDAAARRAPHRAPGDRG